MPFVLLNDAPLTLREFMTKEDLPLAVIFREVATFLSGRSDAVIFGAHAVNAYAHVERMTQDVDVLTTDGRRFAEALRKHLGDTFHIAVRVREVEPGIGFRIYQLRDAKNRHLVDVRHVGVLPAFIEVEGVRILELVPLIAMKVASLAARRGREKGLSDRLDLHRLLNVFPHLRSEHGVVADRLLDVGDEALLPLWTEIVNEQIEADESEAD